MMGGQVDQGGHLLADRLLFQVCLDVPPIAFTTISMTKHVDITKLLKPTITKLTKLLEISSSQ